MKNFFLLSSLLVSLFSFGGCSDSARPTPPSPDTVNDIASSSVNKDSEASFTTLPHRTYSNPQWGFEVSYPIGYEAKTFVENSNELSLSIRRVNDSEAIKNQSGTLQLDVLSRFIGEADKGKFKNPEEWVKFQETIGTNYLPTTVAGQAAYFFNDVEAGTTTYLIFLKNGDMYDRYELKVKEIDPQAQTIFSSFQFLAKST